MLWGIFRNLLNTFGRINRPGNAIEKKIVDTLADNEVFQKIVVHTNRTLEEGKNKTIQKLEESKTLNKIQEQGTTSFIKDFIKLFSEELRKDIKKKE